MPAIVKLNTIKIGKETNHLKEVILFDSTFFGNFTENEIKQRGYGIKSKTCKQDIQKGIKPANLEVGTTEVKYLYLFCFILYRLFLDNRQTRNESQKAFGINLKMKICTLVFSKTFNTVAIPVLPETDTN